MVHASLRRLKFPILYAAVGCALLLEYIKCPLDEEVGNVEAVDSNTLKNRFRGKSALVVGGTRGIGRGIAVALAKAGANVEIAGRSVDSAHTVERVMKATALRPKKQTFGSHSVDLSTVAGCMSFTQQLKEDALKFEYVVFTIGSWPDRVEPNTLDGVDRVVAMDLLARFVILREIQPLLTKGARVLSVLASTQRMMTLGFPAEQDIKEIISGNKPDYWTMQMMTAIGIAGDAMLEQAASEYPDVKFIGTFPGVVPTELITASNTFPAMISTFLSATIQWISRTPIPMFITEEECGENHLQIMSSPNVDKRQATYFNHALEGRRVNDLSYEEDFGKWLWSFLELTAGKHAAE